MDLITMLLHPHPGNVLNANQEAVFREIPELAPLVGLHQGGYHAHDGWGHTLAVVDAVPADLSLRLAALLHDVAKPQTQAPHPKKEGVMQFLGHAREGKAIAEKVCQRLGLSADVVSKVGILVDLHMNPPMLVRNGCSAKGVRNLAKAAGPHLADLLTLSRADIIGKGTSDRDADVELRPIHDALKALGLG